MGHVTRAAPAFLVAFILIAGLAGAAHASPSLSLVWSGTTGTGTTGGAVIDAQAGDTLTLSVLLNVDALGIAGWQISLFGAGVTALSGTECPAGAVAGSFSNFIDGSCFSGTTTGAPIAPGVDVVGSDILGFEGDVGLPGVSGPLAQPMHIARGVFLVTGVPFVEAIGQAVDASYDLHDLHAATIPEPGTLGLLSVGLCALGMRRPATGRRR